MKAQLKLDKLAMSTPRRLNNVYYPYEQVHGFKMVKRIDIRKQNEIKEILRDTKDYAPSKYENIIKYSNEAINLIICTKKKKEHWRIPPVYIIFYTDYYHRITYPDVQLVEDFFRDLNIPLRVSIIHLALDIVSKYHNYLYDKILLCLKPGKKRGPNEKPRYDTSCYFGSVLSGNQLVLYDKTNELEKKGIILDHDVCRLELGMRMHKMNNFIRTPQELADCDWSHVYPKFYSFHSITKELKGDLDFIKEQWRQPIWRLRDIMETDGTRPSNFYRDYLIDHPTLTPLTKQALKNYRWIKEHNR